MSNKKIKNKKSIKIKRGKRKNKTIKQKGGECLCKGIPLFSGGNCAAPLFSGGKCKKCNAFFSGGYNTNLANIVSNPELVIPHNNFINDPTRLMTSGRLTVGGKKSRRRLQKKRGGFVPMNGVTAFGDSSGIATMKNILSGNVNNNSYQPYGNNLTLPSHNIMA